jgi:voltage-gated potassium channel Kch
VPGSDRSAPDGAGKAILLIGGEDLADETERALTVAGAKPTRVSGEDEQEVRDAIEGGGIDRVAVVSGSDAVVMRMALLVRSIDDQVPMLLTIFDQTMADYMAREIEHASVTSLADIVAPSLAGPCIDERFTAVDIESDPPTGLVEDGDDVREEPIEVDRPNRLGSIAQAVFSPHDKSGALMLYGAIGLLTVLLTEIVTAAIVLDQKLVDAIYSSSKALVTVGPNTAVDSGPGWYKLFVSVTMVLAFVSAAGFTAGLVNRLIDRRLTGIVGSRAVPRRGHVVVVGLGQVGLRLCLVLRRCGIPVVAVEQDEDTEGVGRARELGLPVVIGRGADPSLLRRLSLENARAVAAVTAEDLQNIRIAMAAHSVDKDVRLVVRAGDGEVANETRSLLTLGTVRDVHRIAAALIAAMVTRDDAVSVVCLDDDVHLRTADGSLERAEIDALAS